MALIPLYVVRLCLGFALLALALTGSVSAQHASHRLAPIPLEFVERAITIRSGIGRTHDQAATASKEAQGFYDQGLSYLHSYVWIEAARSFNAALKVDPQLALAHVGLSVAYVELSRSAEAQRAIDAARALLPSLPDHDRRHVEVRALQIRAEEAPGDGTRRDLYRKALDAALTAFPRDVELLLLRGKAESPDPAERGQGSTAASVPYYQRALSVAPGHFAAQHYLAHSHENSGRSAEALAASAAFAKQASAVPHAHHMVGHNLRRSGRVGEAIDRFEMADRLHRTQQKQDAIALHYDWHFEHNLGLLATSLQHSGQNKRAATLLEAAFALPTNLLVQAYNKREWVMFLRGRGRLKEADAAARTLIAHPNPVVQATGHIESGFVLLAANRWAEAAGASNTALKLLRGAPGGGVAATALLALQGEINLRTAERSKGRAAYDEVAQRARAAPGPDAWVQALFTLEAMARVARTVGDWELAGRMARHMIEHDPFYGGSQYALALALEQEGRAAEARAAAALALERWALADADLPEVAEMRKKAR